MKTALPVWPLITVFLAGCSAAPLPPVTKIAEIRISVARMPDEKEHRAEPRVAKLTDKKDILEVMDWLHTIDWSQSGQDMAVIRLPRPDGGIVITAQDGKTQDYGYYWDGNFINGKANRLIRGGDMDKWQEIVRRVCQ